MPYVRKHEFVSFEFPAPPKTLVGFQKRFKGDTTMLGKLQETHRVVLLKLRRSCTLMQAEAFGEVRFRRLCRALLIPKSATALASANSRKLREVAARG